MVTVRLSRYIYLQTVYYKQTYGRIAEKYRIKSQYKMVFFTAVKEDSVH
jgi:hypothetical protein